MNSIELDYKNGVLVEYFNPDIQKWITLLPNLPIDFSKGEFRLKNETDLINDAIKNFNFNKVHYVLKALDWEDPITIENLIYKAKVLLKDLKTVPGSELKLSNGYLLASRMDKSYKLHYIIEK